jgi:predicted nucleic acid-binding protein
MKFYMTDTHALFWYLTNSTSLGAAASRAFDEADDGEALIYIPVIVLAELYFLNEKKERPLDFNLKYQRIEESRQFVLLPFTSATILDFDACQP